MSENLSFSQEIYCMRNFLERYMAKELKNLNISYTQALILCKLAEMPDKTATQKELKEFLQVTSASISIVIKRMIENGLLLQKADAKDNRVNIISLTPKAADLALTVSACLKTADEKIGAVFSAKEKECFCSLLHTMQNKLSDKSDSSN